jgi:eukaryotic-like serine/threonine-protein kinase
MKPEDSVAMAAPPGRDALHNLCLADPVWAERYDGWVELGHGGSASVIRTRSKATGEDIALKVFPRLSADEWRRYQDEVRNAQRLTSPHIIRIYSPFPRRTFAWIEMEWVEGPNLRQELEREAPRPLAVSRAVHIALAMARALSTAHAEGVTHRDVKPANILLPASGRPVAKLGDFGLSRLTDAARLTHTGLFVGTPQFAAPEVIEGGTAGPASDVYGLSLCLYLMLSGNSAPFDIEDEASPTQWIRAHTGQAPRPIRSLNERVSEPLATLLACGLDKEPEQRPTAAALALALEGMAAERDAADTDPLTPSAPWTRHLQPPPAPRPVGTRAAWTLVATCIGVVALVAGMGMGVPPTAPVVRPALPVTPPAVTVAMTSASPVSATLPPSGPRPQEVAFKAELRNGLVIVRNAGLGFVSNIRITMLGADGVRYLAQPPETLGPGEDLYVAAEEFKPMPPAALRAASITVAAAALPER